MFPFSSCDHRVYCCHRSGQQVVVSREMLVVSQHDLSWLFGILMCMVISYERKHRGECLAVSIIAGCIAPVV
jgi:hypothetical protein